MSFLSKIKNSYEIVSASLMWVWEPISSLAVPLLKPLFYLAVFSVFGHLIKYYPPLEMQLNNGFYVLGIDVAFRFSEALGTLAFLTSMIGTIFGRSMGRLSATPSDDKTITPRVVKDLSPKDVYSPTVELEDISGNLNTVTFAVEKKLQKADILDLDDLSKMNTSDLMDTLNITATLADKMIDEAKDKLAEWRREGKL